MTPITPPGWFLPHHKTRERYYVALLGAAWLRARERANNSVKWEDMYAHRSVEISLWEVFNAARTLYKETQ